MKTTSATPTIAINEIKLSPLHIAAIAAAVIGLGTTAFMVANSLLESLPTGNYTAAGDVMWSELKRSVRALSY